MNTSREIIQFLQAPVSKKTDEYPISISTRFHHEFSADGKKIHLIEAITTKGFQEVVYDYGYFEVEIVKPLVATRRIQETLGLETDKNWKVKLDEKTKKHGKNGSVQYSVGHGGADLIVRILEQLNFVFERYQSEKGWPTSFLKTLLDVAFQYAEHSTYVVIRQKSDGDTKGKIVGSIRLISAPYLEGPKDHSDMSARFAQKLAEIKLTNDSRWIPGFSIGNRNENDLSSLIPNWNKGVWNNIFENSPFKLTSTQTAASLVQISNGVSFVATPFEAVLNRSYWSQRKMDLELEGNHELSYFVEPGNFAVIPDRDLPDQMKGIAASALYFHIARLIRVEAGALGRTTRIGTYASEGSSSDRFYQSLGFALHEKIEPQSDKDQNNPTTETWNVLLSDGNALNTALLKRFRLRMSEGELETMYRPFDQFENEAKKNSFFDRVSRSLLGVLK